jgi:hypothetical protein
MRLHLELIPLAAALVVAAFFALLQLVSDRAESARLSALDACLKAGGSIMRCYDGL